MPFCLYGLPVSAGIAIGHVHLISHALLEVNHYQLSPKHLKAEHERLDAAHASVKGELVGLKTAVAGNSTNEAIAFVDLQILLLDDPMLIEGAHGRITAQSCNAEWALVQQMEGLVAQFKEIEDPYLRERQADIVQVVERLVKSLIGHPGHLPPKRKDGLGTIVVAHDLSPSDTLNFRDHNITGFVTDVGGPTSHTAIVARSLKIPAVVGLHHIRKLICDGEIIIVDGLRGVVIVDPDPAHIEEYRLRRASQELERSQLNRLKDTPPVTLDGQQIELFANIEGPRDVASVKANSAQGVGLYRTEFLFMGRSELPNEEEQYEAYRSVLKALPGKPVTIRTLDVGADKALNTPHTRIESNPALGLWAVRYSLSEPTVFLTQLRALLRASVHGTLRIMIPMLSHANEIEQCLTMLEHAKEQLRERKLKFDEDVQIGCMIEVPAAALALGMFVKHFQFFSIGTNDLIQYTLAIDRQDEAVAHLYDPLHPAVLRLIAGTIETGARENISVSICGEMAGQIAYTSLLLGMGLRQFSMHPSSVLEVKQLILRADVGKLKTKVGKILKMDDPAKIREAVSKL